MTRWLDLLRRSPTARVLVALAAYVALAALGQAGSVEGRELWHPGAGLGVAVVAVAGRSMIPVVVVGQLLAGIVTGDALGRDVYLSVLDAVLVGGAYASVGLVLRDRPVRALSRPTDVAVLLGVLLLGAAPAALAGTAVDRIAGTLGPAHLQAAAAWFQADAIGMLAVVPLALAVAAAVPSWAGWVDGGPRLEAALRRSDDIVAVVSSSGVPRWWNGAAERFFAPSRRGSTRSADDVFAGGADRTRRLVRRMQGGAPWVGDDVLVASDGQEIPVTMSVVPDVVRDRTVGYTLFARVRDEDEAREMSVLDDVLRDPLTGLPNRILAVERIAHAGERLRGAALQSVVLLLDVDRFSVVNDTLGRDSGDELLRAIGERVRSRAGSADMVARLAADGFALVVEDLDGVNAVMARADEVLESLRPPFDIGGSTVVVSASIGIVRVDPDDSAEEILRRAELAVHRAKSQGGARWVMYDDRLARSADRRLRLESWIRRRVLEDSVPLHFQPVVDLRTGGTPFAQAVLRPDAGGFDSVAPPEVLAVAAATGLLGDLTRSTILGAARAASAWPSSMGVAIPLGPDQVRHGQIVSAVSETLARTEVPAERLIVIFEEESGHDPALLATVAGHCRDRGIRTALELGVGAAGLSTLRTVPVDILVLPATLLDELGTSPQSRAIAGAVLGVAEVLELTVVAAGIVSDQELDVARSLGCHLAQGPRISVPLPADALAPWAAGRS